MPSSPLPIEAKNCPANNQELFYFNCFDGAFISGLLGGVLKLRRHFIDDDLCDVIAHLIDFRAGFNAQAAGGTAIVNSYFHKFFPLNILTNKKAAGFATHSYVTAYGCSVPRLTSFANLACIGPGRIQKFHYIYFSLNNKIKLAAGQTFEFDYLAVCIYHSFNNCKKIHLE